MLFFCNFTKHYDCFSTSTDSEPGHMLHPKALSVQQNALERKNEGCLLQCNNRPYNRYLLKKRRDSCSTLSVAGHDFGFEAVYGMCSITFKLNWSFHNSTQKVWAQEIHVLLSLFWQRQVTMRKPEHMLHVSLCVGRPYRAFSRDVTTWSIVDPRSYS